MAAVLACGRGAVLSHRSAAALLGLRPTSRARIDVTTPHRAGRRRAGIDAHAGNLCDRDKATIRGIPCTTVAPTLLDLADVVDRRDVERACEQAETLRLLDLGALQDVLARADGRRGAPILRGILADFDPTATLTRTELEKRFLALCRGAGIPAPRVNAWVPLKGDGFEVDFSWPDQRLIVEVDGYRTHGTRAAFERDRGRDRLLTLAGWRVIRFTWRHLVREPDEVADTVRRLLGG
jgi:very-short-patch-repair endonuclease